MLSSAGLAAARRVLTSSGAAASWHQSAGLATRALALRLAMPSVRMISISASMRMPAAKATTSKPKPKSKTTKSTKSKSSTTKSTTKKTAKPKAKKPVKKAVKKKAVVKKPKKAIKKKTLTPEEKEKAEIRKLKQMALLKGPTFLPDSAWLLYLVENLRGGASGDFSDKVRAISTSFKNLPETEKERLISISSSNKIANQETKKKWIESFPPEAIHAANLARRRLSRKTAKSRTFLIHDERLPQRSGSAFTMYIKEQFNHAGADTAKDAMRTMGERWRSLSPDEKAPYMKDASERNKVSGEQLKVLREKGAQYWKEKLAAPPAAN